MPTKTTYALHMRVDGHFCWSWIAYLNFTITAGVSVESLTLGSEYTFLCQLCTRFACEPSISVCFLCSRKSLMFPPGVIPRGHRGARGGSVYKNRLQFSYWITKAQAWKLQCIPLKIERYDANFRRHWWHQRLSLRQPPTGGCRYDNLPVPPVRHLCNLAS